VTVCMCMCVCVCVRACVCVKESLYIAMTISLELKELQSHYSVLVRSMPDDYMNTVNQLERYLTGHHIWSILECSNVVTANQRILDSFIEQIRTKEDILLFCNRLKAITDFPLLTEAIDSLRNGMVQ